MPIVCGSIRIDFLVVWDQMTDGFGRFSGLLRKAILNFSGPVIYGAWIEG
ncbi:MAG: hypothetical protein AAFX96_11200 [Pseudomonadota bacterium]